MTLSELSKLMEEWDNLATETVALALVPASAIVTVDIRHDSLDTKVTTELPITLIRKHLNNRKDVVAATFSSMGVKV